MIVSFDEMTGIYRGKRLTACIVPTETAASECLTCAIHPCIGESLATVHCCGSARKDGRYIIWKEASA